MARISCNDNLGNQHSFEEKEFINRKAAYGVYIKDNQILMVKDATSSFFELPGGGLDTHENVLEGLKREFLEETGLIIHTNLNHITTYTEYFYDLNAEEPWKTERMFYKIEDIEGEIKNKGNGDDVQEVRMISKEELSRILIKENIRKIVGIAFHPLI